MPMRGYQIGPGSAGPSASPLPPVMGPRRQMGPPYEPQVAPQRGGAAVQNSPFRRHLEQMFEQRGNQPEAEALPEIGSIDYDAIRGSLNELKEPELNRGRMSPEERRSFLMDWGMRSLAASGQPMASFAGAMGSGGVGAMEGHRDRRREDYDVAERGHERGRRRVMDDTVLQQSNQNQQVGTYDRAERTQARQQQADQQQQQMLMSLAASLMQDDRAGQPRPQVLNTEEGPFAYGGGTTATPITGPDGNPLRGLAGRTSDIERRYQMAVEAFSGDPDAARRAARHVLGIDRQPTSAEIAQIARSLATSYVSMDEFGAMEDRLTERYDRR